MLNPGYCIQFRHSVGNLHIDLIGNFNGLCAWELIKTIRREHTCSGRIFVSTAGLNRVLSAGVDLFKLHMSHTQMPSDWLYFKGDKGFEIAPDGSRVIICGKKPNQQERKNGTSTRSLRYDHR